MYISPPIAVLAILAVGLAGTAWLAPPPREVAQVSSYDTEFSEREPELRCEEKPYPFFLGGGRQRTGGFVFCGGERSLQAEPADEERGSGVSGGVRCRTGSDP